MRNAFVTESSPAATCLSNSGAVRASRSTRLTVEPDTPAFSPYELSQLTGQPREHLEFTLWYLVQRKFVTRDDQSRLTITVDGVDFVESHGDDMKRRLTAVTETSR